MTRFQRLLVCCLLCWAGSWSALPRAAAQPSTAAAAEAKRLFASGKKHYESRRYIDALDVLLQAYARVQRSSVALMLARCYRRLERPDGAATYYRRYTRMWEAEKPGQTSAHEAEVAEQTEQLGRVVGRVQQAEALLDHGDAVRALPLLHEALRASGWARIHTALARCYVALKRPDQARSHLKVAAGLWEAHRVAWAARHPDRDPPDQQEIAEALKRIGRVEQSLQAKAQPDPPTDHRPADARPAGETTPADARPAGETTPADARPAGETTPADHKPADHSTAAPVTPSSPPAAAPPRRSRLWLALGISGAALAVGGEVMAWVSYNEATHYYDNEPEYDRFSAISIAGHVIAGSMAVLSGVSFYLYVRSGKQTSTPSSTPRGAVLLPYAGPRGAGVSGIFSF